MALFGKGIAYFIHKAKEKRSRMKKGKEKGPEGRRLKYLEEKIQEVETCLYKLDGNLESSLDDVYECLDKNPTAAKRRENPPLL